MWSGERKRRRRGVGNGCGGSPSARRILRAGRASFLASSLREVPGVRWTVERAAGGSASEWHHQDGGSAWHGRGGARAAPAHAAHANRSKIGGDARQPPPPPETQNLDDVPRPRFVHVSQCQLGSGRPGVSAGPLGASLNERTGSQRPVEGGTARTGCSSARERLQEPKRSGLAPKMPHRQTSCSAGMAVATPLANNAYRTALVRRTCAFRLCEGHDIVRHSIQPRTSPPDCERSRCKPQDPLPAGIPGPLPPLRDSPPCGPRLTTRLRGLESVILTSGP